MSKDTIKFSWKNVNSFLVWGTIAVVFILDQITKYLVMWNVELGERIEILSFFNITHSKNKGAAFGMFHDWPAEFRLVFFAIITVVCIWMVIYWIGTTPKGEKLLRFCFSLILGGALGNAKDRLFFQKVTDFIQVYYKEYYFPSFNIADSAITVGVVLLLVSTFFKDFRTKKASRK